MLHKVKAVAFEDSCAKTFAVPPLTLGDDLSDISKHAKIEDHLIKHLKGTTALIHYFGVYDDGSSKINGYRFVWTGHDLHRY